ncbi:unnamed protein product [Malus baccata var. baccata]
MALGEVFLAAFLQLLLDRLTPREILEYLGNFRGVGQKLEKWRTTLSTIGAVLSDAEESQLTEGGVKLWLDDLRDLAYDIEDMLDKFAVKMLKRMIEGRDQASTSRKVRRSFYKVKLSFDMNSEMKKITKRLQDISERKDNFGLKDTGTSAKESRSLPSSGVIDEKLVVGRDGDKGKIIELLKKSTDFGVVAIVGMPGVGKITLPLFVVSEGSDQSGIREIGPLLHLRGTLCLLGLENVTNVEDARRANLKCKEKIDSLVLKWYHSSDTRETESAVLDMLQPHTKLKELTIEGYAREEFSSWVGGPLFSNMVLVRLEECNNCLSLPPLGQLPRLKELYVRGMNAVESVGAEFYGERILPFPLLEILEFVDMRHWKVWLPFQLDHGSGVFPCLKRLSINECSKLEGKLPEKLDLLAELEIVKCEELTVSIANYKQLRQLNIDGCKVLEHTAAKVEFELLESLCISNISEVMSRPTGELFKKGLSKVRDLKINGCEKLTSSLKNEARLLQRLTSLGRLEIEDNSRLVEELGEEAEELLQLQILDCKLELLELRKCENLLKLPKGLNQLSSLQELRIYKCSSLVSFPDVGLPPSLKRIEIRECDSLIYFAKFQIPQNLKRIEIWHCKSLKSLVDEEECERLGLIAPNGFFSDNTNDCLEYIRIWNCQNLKSLPDGLCHLSNLQTLRIEYCGSLVSIPRLSGGLREIWIQDCEKLEALPEDMHNLNSLEELMIDYREGLTFPPNLIWKVKSCKSLWELEWGLHRLTSLRFLYINSEDPDTVSFPPDMVRMETLKSLAHLRIVGFPNLKKLSSKGFQFLTSLQSLCLYNCPKLAFIPEEGLPPSLEELSIDGCPVLEERCQPGKGRYWYKISHIPFIYIDRNLI